MERVAHASERWARAVAGASACPHDPTTLLAWGNFIGVSRGALRAWCAVARQPAKASLDLARLLRAITIAHQIGEWAPADLLDVVDPRTMRTLLRKGGLTRESRESQCPSIDEFLAKQQLIAAEEPIRALKQIIAFGGKGQRPFAGPVAPPWPAERRP
jgi:hypothetical protein